MTFYRIAKENTESRWYTMDGECYNEQAFDMPMPYNPAFPKDFICACMNVELVCQYFEGKLMLPGTFLWVCQCEDWVTYENYVLLPKATVQYMWHSPELIAGMTLRDNLKYIIVPEGRYDSL